MIKYLFSPLLFIIFLINPFYGVETGADANIHSIPPSDKALLLQVPPSKSKGTVGIVPYVIHNHDLYVLLGRERADGPKEKAGMYCDLGGSLKSDGSRVIDNLIRELWEESCKVFNLRKEDVLQKGKLLYKKSDTGREIYYLLYPLSKDEYRSADFLGNKVKNSTEEPSEFLEKDQFMWVNIQDLLKFKNLENLKEVKVRNIDGEETKISLRPFFYNDFCKHKQLADTIDQILTNNSDSMYKRYAAQ